MRQVFLIHLLAVLATLHAAPATQPTQEIPALIGQLSDPDWKLRQKAQERLVSIGDPAIEALKQIVQQTKDEEVRTRAESALRQIAENARTGPTLVTLHVKDAP